MTIMINEVNPSLDEALEHYGVKGMRWGVRKDGRNSRRKTRKTRNAAIKTARKETKKAYSDFKAADKEYWRRRGTEGEAAAKKILERQDRKTMRVINGETGTVARQKTSGEQKAAKVRRGALMAANVAIAAAAVKSVIR